MDIKDLNKSQLILLAVLLSFVVSIATGITTVTLMQQAPDSMIVPVTRIIRETVEKIVPVENEPTAPALSAEEKRILEDLKAIKPLTVTLFLRNISNPNVPVGTADKILGTGLFLGDNKVVIASVVPELQEGEVYVVKSVLGEQQVSNITVENDFSIVELEESEDPIDTTDGRDGESSSEENPA